MTKLKIRITKEILEKSKNCQQKVDSCAIALSVRDIFPNAFVYYKMIFPFGLNEEYEGVRHSYAGWEELRLGFRIHAELASFINCFDHCIDPTELPERDFEINIPDWVIERINIEELRPLLQNHPTLQLV